MKRKRPKNVFLGHLNINSIKNKFESVWELIKDTFDIFLLSESKLYPSFPDDQFSIPGYRIVRKYRDRNGGGLLLYINEDIPFKIIQNSSLPYKQKKVQCNNNPFMTKQLRKKIIVRSKLRNEFNKSRASENWKKYKQQRNKYLSILKGTKTNYLNNLNPKVITDNKKFWPAVKPLFLDKNKAMNTVVLYKNGKIIKNYKRLSEVLNKYFTNLTKSLKLKKCISRKSFLNTSIKKINQSYPKTETFSFREIRETETIEIIKSLPKNKATVFKDIPMRIIKDAAHVYSYRLTIIFNNCIKNSQFPEILKYADITPAF